MTCLTSSQTVRRLRCAKHWTVGVVHGLKLEEPGRVLQDAVAVTTCAYQLLHSSGHPQQPRKHKAHICISLGVHGDVMLADMLAHQHHEQSCSCKGTSEWLLLQFSPKVTVNWAPQTMELDLDCKGLSDHLRWNETRNSQPCAARSGRLHGQSTSMSASIYTGCAGQV